MTTSLETALIGDVHGESKALRDILQIALPKSKRIVFLGDLINRGRNSRQVLDTILTLEAEASHEIIVLQGNHDEAFRDVLLGPGRESEFLRMGGATTIQSYVAPPFRSVFDQLRDAVPARHSQLLASQKLTWESENVIARHAYTTGDPDDKNRFQVAGHSVRTTRLPKITDGYALIDTGCGTLTDGRLTAFYWPSRTFDQVGVGAK